jgi:hypothetical protein
MRLVAHGCDVTALCPRGHVLGHVSGLRKVHRYVGSDSMARLKAAIADARPAIVIPCDDRLVWQLHELHRREPRFRELIETSLGAFEFFDAVRSRSRTLEIASRLGVRIPETAEILGESDIRDWFARFPGPAVIKLDGTWGGRGVEFVSSPAEGAAALRRFTRAEPIGTAWKQHFINRDPLAFWRGQKALGRSVTMQRFIAGRQANAMVACWRGEVLGEVGVEVLCTQGTVGASTVIKLCRNAGMSLAASKLAAELRASGFFGLDFIIEAATGVAYLIELNPRCTQLGHIVLPDQGDLVGLICGKLGARQRGRTEIPVRCETIALFPQALAWNPESPYLRDCHHDVPWTEPAVVGELLGDSWAERRWIARLYHRLRGIDRSPVPDLEAFGRLAAAAGWSSLFAKPPKRSQQRWGKA